ncbi:MAG: hypothetical protein AAB935_01220 [Patescibacteria group bacterium]
MNKSNKLTLLSIAILASSLFVSFYLIASAISADDIQYPVAELGDCTNEENCKAFCDRPENMQPCVAFAEKHDLISQDEAERAKKFIDSGGKGPGGCTGQEACESYCNDVSKINECVNYAEENGLMSPKELAEAKKVQAALARGAKLPGGCRGKNDCDNYCNNPDNMEECITFAKEAGFMEGKELEEAEKVLIAVKKGAKPPACRGKEECDVYCGEENHFEECMVFAEAAGFMTAEEAQMARKTGGKGPGDCRGKEECEGFCNDPANGEVCFNFAKEHGLISGDELRQMEEGKQQTMEAMGQAPPEVAECLNSALGSEMIEKIKTGTIMPNRQIGEKMEQCFQKMGPPPDGSGNEFGPPNEGRGGSRSFPGQGFPEEKMTPRGFDGGPGGCKTSAECQTFCETNPEECQSFVPPRGERFESSEEEGRMMPPFGEGEMPPDGGMPPGFEGGFQGGGPMPDGFPANPPSPEQFQQFQGQYQQQFEQQFQEQYQGGQFNPPPDGQYPQGGQFGPPPDMPPSPPDGPPQSQGPLKKMFAVLLAPFIDFLLR